MVGTRPISSGVDVERASAGGVKVPQIHHYFHHLPPPPMRKAKPSARAAGKTPTAKPSSSTKKKSPGFSLEEVNRIKAERESRRQAIKDAKEASARKAKAYKDAGIVGDVDFLEMIEEWHVSHRKSLYSKPPKES